jgi:hypothetical protein
MRNSAIVTTFNATADLLVETQSQHAAAISVVSHISPEHRHQCLRNDLSPISPEWSPSSVGGLLTLKRQGPRGPFGRCAVSSLPETTTIGLETAGGTA